MRKNNWGHILLAWIKSRRLAVLYFVVFVGVLLVVYRLYGVPWGTGLYAALIGAVAGLGFAVYDALRYWARQQALAKLVGRYPLGALPPSSDLLEQRYQKIITELEKERERLTQDSAQKQKQDEEYYMLWAHQIKTPMAAMRLVLQQSNAGIAPEMLATLETELFQTEQYVGMVLQYLRLSSLQSDLLFQEVPIEGLVKKAVKNLAPLFIYKGLPVEIISLKGSIITDEKWFVFVLEQLLTNGLKYTSRGKITICQQEDTLLIKDTGIGIRPEDLPRVFEKGYTGAIGRVESRSTGIGLYLSKEVLNRLGFRIALESELGKGTTVLLNLKQDRLPEY